jgi:hypothetical protein
MRSKKITRTSVQRTLSRHANAFELYSQRNGMGILSEIPSEISNSLRFCKKNHRQQLQVIALV